LSYAQIREMLGPSTVAAIWFSLKDVAGVMLACRGLSSPALRLYNDGQMCKIKRALNAFSATEFQEGCIDSEFDKAWSTLGQALQMREVCESLIRANKVDKDGPGGDTYFACEYSELVIVPHGVFQRVPISALHYQLGDTDRLCLSDLYGGGVFYSPSLALLHAVRSRPLAPLSLSAAGFVAVQNPMRNLPGSDHEVRAVARLLSDSVAGDGAGAPTVLAHEGATVAALLRAIAERGASGCGGGFAMHLSCHGGFEAESRWQSWLQLAGGERLTVGDMMDLRLQRCHLCVLAACETARTCAADRKRGSTEPVGLATAALVAGARRVVATAWRVSDAASALFFACLYRRLLKSGGMESLTSAVRQSQIWLQQLSLAEALDKLRDWVGPEASDSFSEAERRGCGPLRLERQTWVNLSELWRGADPDDAGFESIVTSLPWEGQALCGTRSGKLQAAAADFKEEDWRGLAEAAAAGRLRLLHSHLFPFNARKSQMLLPEREFWLEYLPPLGQDGGPVRVVVHVHCLGRWADLDETRVAQVCPFTLESL
jgi:hypothetical protein